MATQPQTPLEPRKTPVQARSTVTVEAIYEATFQVLLAGGADRLTTTRVAKRAGVSVGTLYQYFPNKQSLLLSVLKKHQDQVASAVELACRRNHGQQVSTMIESVVEAFVDAKMERSDISMALYATAVGAQERALVNKGMKRARDAMVSMLATAPNTKFGDLPFTSLMLISAMGGATRAVLEAPARSRKGGDGVDYDPQRGRCDLEERCGGCR
jgi:AcrR family transcriptional regulator